MRLQYVRHREGFVVQAKLDGFVDVDTIHDGLVELRFLMEVQRVRAFVVDVDGVRGVSREAADHVLGFFRDARVVVRTVVVSRSRGVILQVTEALSLLTKAPFNVVSSQTEAAQLVGD